MKRRADDDIAALPSEPKKQKTDEASNITFATLGLDSRLLQALKRDKFATPTPVQVQAIPLALDGKHVLARSKTGSGKTLAYLLPVIQSILRRKVSPAAKQVSALLLVPTKELATQVSETLKSLTSGCGQDVRFENISRKEDAAVTRARLAEKPDILVATPSRVNQFVESGDLQPDTLTQLVIDEADLVLSYGYDEDLESLAASLPSGVQKIFMSATLRAEVDSLNALFFKTGPQPTVIDLSQEEAAEQPALNQYTVRTAEQDKFLLVYTIFKLQLIKGKVIIFVADVDRCYRLKLFLEQFGVRSCILNSELPVNSRLHAVQEFNKGVYDIIIAADETEVVGDETSKRKRQAENEDEEEVDEEGGAEDDKEAANEKSKEKPIKPARRPRRSRGKKEFGVSRGIDFRNVACVLNFDLPTTSKSYIHRIGRTARAGQTGMALSFYVPTELYRKHKPTSIEQCKHDEKVLAKIKKRQEEKGQKVEEWAFDMTKLEAFRYRLADALRAVTRIAVREARTKELRQELINSEKLKRYFEENPDDLKHLRHDTESHAVRHQPHLKHVPDYLMPAGGKQAVAKDVGFVSMRKDKENRLRRARAVNKGRKKGMIAKTKGLDPLRSLNVRGRGKK